MAIRVLIAVEDSDPTSGLSEVLGDDPSFSVAGVIRKAAEGWRLIENHEVDVLFVDLDFDNAAGGVLVRQVLTERPGLPIVVLTCPCDDTCVDGLFRIGVLGVVSRHSSWAVLLEAIQAAHAGRRYVDEMLPEPLGPALDAPECAMDRLNDREHAICRFLALGYTEHEIMARLCMPAWVVRKTCVRGMFKLGVVSHEELESLAGCLEKSWCPESES